MTLTVRWARKKDLPKIQVFRATVLGKAYDNDLALSLRDEDAFDRYCDILMVLDGDKLVGTYRFLRYSRVLKLRIQFYSAGEFDISKVLRRAEQKRLEGLASTPPKLIDTAEVGRSCVLEEYRNGAVIAALWRGIAEYQKKYNIDAFFGCASLEGTDLKKWNGVLSYLRYKHLAPKEFRVKTLKAFYTKLGTLSRKKVAEREKSIKEVMATLVRGYTKLGAWIGDGAFIDKKFNSIDVFIYLIIEHMNPAAARHYFRVETDKTKA